MFKKPLFKEAFIMLVITLAANQIGYYFGLYLYNSPIKEYDSLVHFFGGMTVALTFLWFYFYSGIFEPTNKSYLNFFKISLLSIIFVGFAWEIYELFMGEMNGLYVGATSIISPWYGYDTGLDMLFDLFGITVATIYAFNRKSKAEPVNTTINVEVPANING